MRKKNKIRWRRESLYGNYVPSRGASNPDTACFVMGDPGSYRAIDKFYGEDKHFETLGAAKRGCEKRILARA